ncbi:hypothetical protein [Deinococcus sp. Leaf326]|uniref:hypothetical protein n=1 Tax=Deinococcus sp. Leaf326 TaxID=1736338 RepID=UPI0009EB4039
MNSSGQLGDGTTTIRVAPVGVLGVAGGTSVTAGTAHSSALRSDGTVQSWGRNDSGQVGDGPAATKVDDWAEVIRPCPDLPIRTI